MITHVTVLEDRAQVRRKLDAKVTPGFQRLRIEGVTSLVHDRSISARATGCKVLDARCVRRWVIGVAEAEGDLKTLLEVEAAAAKEREGWTREYMSQEREREELRTALELGIEGVQRELPLLTALPDALTKTVPELAERLRQVEQRFWEARRALREGNDKGAALVAKREHMQNPESKLVAAIELDVEADTAGDASITVEYLVPCAAWRPMHRARLIGNSVTLETDAAVWQATGESWDDVQLAFSTARSTQRAEPPLLQDDVITPRDKQTKQVIAQVRQQRVQTTGEGMGEADVPGVDDGGESRLLGAAKKASVAGNGRLHRVPLLSFQSDCQLERTARPELSPLVHLLSRQKNTSAQPILAGPVELSRESGVVGGDTISFVAPGETFVLGWGGDDGLRIKREPSETRDTARLTDKLTIERTVTLYLSNLAPSPAEFQVEERIPVSELAQVDIKVDDKKTSPLKQPDEHGIIRWQVSLKPLATDTIRLAYALVASSDVKGL